VVAARRGCAALNVSLMVLGTLDEIRRLDESLLRVPS
jgi:hypothetical protein